MNKKQFIAAIEAGASIPVDASKFSIDELTRMARAAKKHGFVLEVRSSKSFSGDTILNLAGVAPGHIYFPDAEIEGICF